MPPEMRTPRGHHPQGVKTANKATSSRPSKSTTTRYRVPANWRDRVPEPAAVYRTRLKDLSPPGRDGWGTARCPFHEGVDLTLSVDLAGSRGGWRCSVCSAHGDLVAFVQKLEGLSFPAAVHVLMDVARRPRPSANAADHIERCRALLQEVKA